MYQLVREWASPHGRTLLLDVCCGTGTIGLTLAKNVKTVLGIDVVASAIEDARANASLNGIDNCDWIVAKAEDALPALFNEYAPLVMPKKITYSSEHATSESQVPSSEVSDSDDGLPIYIDEGLRKTSVKPRSLDKCAEDYEYDDIVAIVDPPRAGLHKSVLHALRKQTGLRRIVYISCNPESMASNCIELCTPQGPDGNSGGSPFTPTKAFAVDLFPHTMHCEAVVLLER
jgi:tRNA (uracil-5-)-methyltransferase